MSKIIVILAFLETILDAPGNVFADGFGFGLRESSVERDHEFRVDISGVDVFFLENHGNAHAFKLADILKAVDCVSGKTADAFDEDKVNIAFLQSLIILLKEVRFLVWVPESPLSAKIPTICQEGFEAI